MDPIKDLLKKSGMSNILISIIFGLFGVILCVFHEGAVKLISCLIGLLFLMIGVARLVNYVKGRGRGEHLNFDLFCGLIATLAGIIANEMGSHLKVTYTDAIGAILRIIVGTWIVYSGITRAYLSLKIKGFNSSIWIFSLVLSILMIIFGIYIMLNSGAIITLIGSLMIAYAIIDIIESFIFIRKLKQF